MMGNGAGFDEAAELAHAHGLGDRIGVHLVLTEGVPLTDAIRRLLASATPRAVFASGADASAPSTSRPPSGSPS